MAEQSYLILTTRIQDAYSRLSDSERRLADFVLDSPHRVMEATARELAEASGVSTATVIRFCHACGFSGFTELKLCIRREDSVSEDNKKYTEVQEDDTISTVRRKILGYHTLIVNDMLLGWNEAAYSLAVEALVKAKRILIFGEGGSRCSAMCMFHILVNLGLPCETYMDSVFEIMKVGSLEEGDVVIGVTYTGRLRNTVDSLKLAKQRGATTIGLVGYLDSPVMDYVDVVLNTTRLTKDYYDSALSIRVSEMLVIELLSTLLAMKLDRPISPTISPDHVVSIRRIWDEEKS